MIPFFAQYDAETNNTLLCYLFRREQWAPSAERSFLACSLHITQGAIFIHSRGVTTVQFRIRAIDRDPDGCVRAFRWASKDGGRLSQ